MKSKRMKRPVQLSAVSFALLAVAASAGAADAGDPAGDRLDALQRQVSEQSARLDALKRAVAKEEASLNEVKRALSGEALATQRGRGESPVAQAQTPTPAAGTATQQPVGQARKSDERAPAAAQMLDLPGVLTPAGKFVLEPSLQYSYSSSDRVALVGYTVIPAILIGLIDVRQTNRNTFNAALTGRMGITNRFEVEARVPYSYRSDTSVGRPFGVGGATDSAFSATGRGIGDVEFTARYQLNDGGVDKPFYVGALRVKTRTGKDPFEITTAQNINGFAGGVQTELPTGSGFIGIQPSLTVLYPSDPAVFFGSVSYLYSVSRNNVIANFDSGPVNIGKVSPGGIIGVNFGMGLGLNEQSSTSIGFDLSSVAPTKGVGSAAPDAVRFLLSTLQLGYSYRIDSQRTLSLTLGAGLTRDTPDVTLTARMPYSF